MYLYNEILIFLSRFQTKHKEMMRVEIFVPKTGNHGLNMMKDERKPFKFHTLDIRH